MKNNTRIVDIEVSPNYFLFGSLDAKDNIEYFEVIDTPDFKINQLQELYTWMVDKQFICYNGLEYDAMVLEKIFDKLDESVNVNNADIFEIGQDVINAGRPFRWEHQLRHKWLDLLQLNHWGIKSAKTASLKWLQFSTNQDILDLPYKYDMVLTLEQIKEVREYCLNSDIPATKKIYDLCQSEIKIRFDVGKEENLSLLNASEPKIARKLFSKHLAKELGIDEKSLKDLKTLDVPFKGSDVLLPYLKFQNSIFQKIHEDIKNIRLSEEGKFKRTVNWNGLKIEYGLGGLHSFRYPKIWESNEEYIIIDSDAKSFYPNLCIRNNKYPRHLGDSFGKIYEGYYNKRIGIPKKDPMNYVMKIVLNAGYGKNILLY